MTTTLTITINARTIERVTAFTRYMTEWGELASAAEGRQMSAAWSIEEAARSLLERAAADWEKEIRERTGLNAEPIAIVAAAAAAADAPQ